MHTQNIHRRYMAFTLLLGVTGTAFAQTPINQSNALAGNVTPGDTPNFPVTISRTGSYQLTSNLNVRNANTTAILVTGPNVTIDLNGFVIQGVTLCLGSGAALICSPAGSGSGIAAAPTLDGIVVSNGHIWAMGGSGISLGSNSRIERVTAIRNGAGGIVARGIDNVVTGNTANNNGDVGIFSSGAVNGNTASFNRGTGIVSGSGGTFSDNAANGNGGDGIAALGTMSNNTATRNGRDGIAGRGTVVNNSVLENGRFGLFLHPTAGYTQNNVNSNNGGDKNPQVSGGINLGQNVCGGDTVCP